MREGSPPGIDPGQSGQSGPANQLQEKRLCLVVPRVADRDLAGVEVRGAAVQKGVARPARGILDAQMLRRSVVSDVNVADDDWQLEPGCQRATELLVAVGGRAKAMVHVRQAGQGETAIDRELPEDQGESD
jgi:hypothetical protein